MLGGWESLQFRRYYAVVTDPASGILPPVSRCNNAKITLFWRQNPRFHRRAETHVELNFPTSKKI
jgi:hypothetical protein